MSTVGSFVYQAFGYKDAVIVALTENKGSQNDVDQIKPHIQQVHGTQNPEPRHGHRQESDKRVLKFFKRNPQKNKHNDTANPPDIIEVLR